MNNKIIEKNIQHLIKNIIKQYKILTIYDNLIKYIHQGILNMQYKIIEYTSQDLNLHFRYITKFEKRLRDFENKSQDL